MKKHYYHCAIALAGIYCLFASTLSAQDKPVELKGEFMSKQVDCDPEHSLLHAFDGDETTYYHSCANITSGNWIGIDLGKKHIVTSIAYAPRNSDNYRERLQLGVFEGANEPDFGDALPLFIIPGATEQGLTTQPVNCTRGFRYVRFVFPTAQQSGKSSYIGELKFYGYEGEGDDTWLPQLTNLPTVSIHTVNAEDITSKENYVKGIISVVYANGTKTYKDSLEIRGRGNNSWTHPKKPYRLKLFKSARLMELPAKAKNWTLINNYGDKTLMRNILAFDFSRRIEMPYTSPAEAVDVVLNGDYKGCYQLSDHIDVREERVDIEEMGAEDLTGGYMVEIDAYADSEPKKFTSSQYNIPVTIKYPKDDEITQAQEKYIEAHFNKLMQAAKSVNYQDAENGFRKYMDIETFLRHFLVGEYAANTDTYWSVRMTKKRDEDRFCFGPVWDFDLAFENDKRTYPINEKEDWICFFSGSSAAGGTREFVARILSDKQVEQRLSEIYSFYRDKGVISKEALAQVVDSCAELLQMAQDLNFKRWPIMNSLVHENPVVHGSYAAEVDNVREYVVERVDWLDNKLHYLPGSVLLNSPDAHTINIELTTGRQSLCVNIEQDCRLNIFDLSGRLINERPLAAGRHTIDIAGGIYLLHFVSSDSGMAQMYKCFVP